MRLPVTHRIVPMMIVFAVLACLQVGCSKQEAPTPPANSSYYTGPMVTKPKGAMLPQGVVPVRPATSANSGRPGQ